MIIIIFLLSGVASAILFASFVMLLDIGDISSVIWLSTSLIIASICGCSAWIVKTLKKVYCR